MIRELQPTDPQLIGPYRLRGRLGSGGMGQVYLGLSAGGRSVAVKVVRPELATDPEFRARFRQEIAVAQRVSGLFTAPVIDADVDGPVPWLATAYVRGPSLAEAVSSHGPLPTGSVLALAAGLAEGLGAIHAAGVIHRDLKPANVLLAEDGPRVIDFGISRAVEVTGLTRTGLVVGSPGFMSPEQAEGREVGPPSDIFSLGAVLAFAATGEGPFGSGSTPALVYRVVHSPANLDPLPADVRPLVERCLAKDPGQRPTARELLAAAGAGQPATGWLPESVTRTYAQIPTPAPGGPTSGGAGSPGWAASLGGASLGGVPLGEVEAARAETRPAGAAPGSVPVTRMEVFRSGPTGDGGNRNSLRGRWKLLVAAAVVAGILGASATAGFALTGTPAAHESQSGRDTPVQTISPAAPAPATSASSSTSAPAPATPSTTPPAATIPAYVPPSTPAPATMTPTSSASPTVSSSPTATSSPTTSSSPTSSATPTYSATPSPGTSTPTAPAGGY